MLGILLGDGGGVGPEIIAKVVANGSLNEYSYPVIIVNLCKEKTKRLEGSR